MNIPPPASPEGIAISAQLSALLLGALRHDETIPNRLQRLAEFRVQFLALAPSPLCTSCFDTFCGFDAPTRDPTRPTLSLLEQLVFDRADGVRQVPRPIFAVELVSVLFHGAR
jgi:hypothetical protein